MQFDRKGPAFWRNLLTACSGYNSVLKMEATASSREFVFVYQTTGVTYQMRSLGYRELQSIELS
jgi:hypothetical protein